ACQRVARAAARGGRAGGEGRVFGYFIAPGGEALELALVALHRARERVAQPLHDLEQRQIDVRRFVADGIAGPAVALDRSLEVAEILRNAPLAEILGAPLRLALLLLVVEHAGDRVVHLAGFFNEVGDRELELVRPQSIRLAPRREPEPRPEIQ